MSVPRELLAGYKRFRDHHYVSVVPQMRLAPSEADVGKCNIVELHSWCLDY